MAAPTKPNETPRQTGIDNAERINAFPTKWLVGDTRDDVGIVPYN